MIRARAVLLAALLLSPAARAAVQQSAADSFFVTLSEPVGATPAKAWADLLKVQHWWADDHTFSGKAANLSLAATAGGCFCERWSEGSVEHARVLMALPQRLLRLDGALGPLQELALKGILEFWIRSDEADATRIEVEYRVTGASDSGLDAVAPQVDAMLAGQLGRLVRYIETGSAEPPPEPVAPEEADQDKDARRALLEAWAQSAAEAAAADGKTPAAAKAGTGTAKPPRPKESDGP